MRNERWVPLWRLIDAYDYTYVTINGAHNLMKVATQAVDVFKKSLMEFLKN